MFAGVRGSPFNTGILHPYYAFWPIFRPRHAAPTEILDLEVRRFSSTQVILFARDSKSWVTKTENMFYKCTRCGLFSRNTIYLVFDKPTKAYSIKKLLLLVEVKFHTYEAALAYPLIFVPLWSGTISCLQSQKIRTMDCRSVVFASRFDTSKGTKTQIDHFLDARPKNTTVKSAACSEHNL